MSELFVGVLELLGVLRCLWEVRPWWESGLWTCTLEEEFGTLALHSPFACHQPWHMRLHHHTLSSITYGLAMAQSNGFNWLQAGTFKLSAKANFALFELRISGFWTNSWKLTNGCSIVLGFGVGVEVFQQMCTLHSFLLVCDLFSHSPSLLCCVCNHLGVGFPLWLPVWLCDYLGLYYFPCWKFYLYLSIIHF